MARYKITAVVESDDDYKQGNQIEDLRAGIQMTIADYNCFIIRQDVRFEELKLQQKECNHDWQFSHEGAWRTDVFRCVKCGKYREIG